LTLQMQAVTSEISKNRWAEGGDNQSLMDGWMDGWYSMLCLMIGDDHIYDDDDDDVDTLIDRFDW
jgi:hypothetical protein